MVHITTVRVLGLYLTLFISIQHVQSRNFTVSFTMLAQNMTIDATWIHDDCHNGVISDLNFYTDYTYANDTFCVHNDNPVVPIEWTPAVEALVLYNEKAQQKYAECILTRTCDTIDMTDWRRLAQDQYKVCKYCNITEHDDGISTCTNYISETDSQTVGAIIDTMFLYVEFKCTLQLQSENPEQVLIVPVRSNSNNTSTIKLHRDSFTCHSNDQLHITHITEHAVAIRARKNDNNTALINRVEQHIKSSKTQGNLLEVPSSYWTIHGGYYWGANETGKTDPYCVIISYRCASSITATARLVSRDTTNFMVSPAEKEDDGTLVLSEESVLILAASGVVLIILSATVLALSLTIRNLRKQGRR